MTAQKLVEMIAAAHAAKHRFDELLLRAKVSDSGEARVATTMTLTISEQFAAVLHLLEEGFSTHAPIIARSMLEGLADLLNLAKDPAYLDQLRFNDARSNVTLFEEYAQVPDMQEEKEAIATLKDWKEQAQPVLEELGAKGFKKLPAIESFKRAGMLDNYVAYRVLCSFAHNQLTTLLSRHAGKLQLNYHHEAPVEMSISLLNVAISILCRAMETLPRFSDITEEEFKAVLGQTDTEWAAATQR